MKPYMFNVILIAALFLCGCEESRRAGDSTPFIDWHNLRNPVYSHEGWCTKDACMVYHNGEFYIFTSAFYFDRGRERSHVVGVKTRDFKTFSEPLFIWDGRDEGWIGMCSPNITRRGDEFILTYNSWGCGNSCCHPNGNCNQLFYAVSTDLEHWDKHKPLAPNVTRDASGQSVRAIDAAVEFANDRVYLLWKEQQIPQVAWAPSIDSDEWTRIGRPAGDWFENGQFIQIDGTWHLVCRAEENRSRIAQMLGDGSRDTDWLNWGEFNYITVPEEAFNTDDRCQSAFLADWRDRDGWFYLLYAGRTEGESHARRGDNKLALARSKDLVNWTVPPQP